MIAIDPDGESTTTWMLRAEKAEAELAKAQVIIDKLQNRIANMDNKRDELLSVLETIANNHDCDPRAEAREALEGHS